MLNKLSKEPNVSGHKWSTTHRVLKSHRSKMSIIYMLSWKQCAYLQGYVQSIVKNSDGEFVKIATAIAVGYIRKDFVWNAWLDSECVWNLFLLSYLSIIQVLIYVFIHLLFYLLTSVHVSWVYILAASCYYSDVLACFIIFV